MSDNRKARKLNTYAWDLSAIWNKDDEAILNNLKRVSIRAEKLIQRLISETRLSNEKLRRYVEEYERIGAEGAELLTYFFLKYAEDTNNSTSIQNKRDARLLWLSVLKLHALLSIKILNKTSKDTLLEDAPEFKKYSYFVKSLHSIASPTLKQEQELLVIDRSLSVRDAFQDIYDAVIDGLKIPSPFDSGKYLDISSAISLIGHPVRKVRRRALLNLYREIKRVAGLMSLILNSICHEIESERRIRNLESAFHMICAFDDVKYNTIKKILEEIKGAYPIVSDYMRRKFYHLGIKRPGVVDVNAPFYRHDFQLSPSKTVSIILDALKEISPVFYDIGVELIEKRCIDLGKRQGKLNGAFCYARSPSLPPFISVNYSKNIYDMITLAHEMGHGIHFKLASSNSYINFYPHRFLMEIPSTLMEFFVLHHMMERNEFRSSKRAIISIHIEGMIKNIFRQCALTSFEEEIYKRTGEHTLSSQEISDIWLKEMASLYGIEPEPEYGLAWCHVHHIFKLPFYCYNYVSGGIFAVYIFNEWLSGNQGIIDGLIRFLSSGRSKSPLDLLGIIDIYADFHKCIQDAIRYFNTRVGQMN